MAVVGSPVYFKKREIPRTPQDLGDHQCINLRMLSAGGIESTVRYLGVDVEDALALAEGTEV
jgi:hypothetical protein